MKRLTISLVHRLLRWAGHTEPKHPAHLCASCGKPKDGQHWHVVTWAHDGCALPEPLGTLLDKGELL